MKDILNGVNVKKVSLHIFVYVLECIAYYMTPILISNYLGENTNLDNVYIFIVIFAILLLFRIVLRIYVKRFIELYLDELKFLFSNNVSKKIVSSNMKNIEDKGTGYISNVIEKHNSWLSELVKIVILYIPDTIIAVTIFVYASMSKSIYLGITFILTFVIAVWLYSYFQKKQEKYINKFNIEEAKYKKSYIDYILNLKTVKLIKLDKYVEENLNKQSNIAKSVLKRKYNIEAIKELVVRFIANVPIIIGMLYGVYEMKNGISGGVSTILYFALISSDFRFIITFISDINTKISEYKVAYNNLNDCILNKDDRVYIKDFDSLEIKDLSFKYEGAKFEIKVDDFKVDKTQNVAIIGKSGQGKTTLLNILSKAIITDNIFVDGNVLKNNIEFGYVSQEAEMFNTTVKENLCLGKDIEDSYIIKLLEDLALDNWYNALENGLDTEIGERGIKLSTGQKQRLNIIRAILSDKQAYILDEPTSNLDNHTEQKVIEAINKYLGDKTLIIVTHREKVLEICDKVYKMENHILEEVGINE